MTVPVPVGEIRAIATENTYAAFPSVDRSAAGTALVIYRVGLGHVPAGATVRIRRQPTGTWWGSPIEVAAPVGVTDYLWGTGGLACEPAAYGGRIWVGLIKCRRTGTNSADNYSAHVVWSDDDGLTWSAPVALPVASSGRTILGGLLALANGTLLASVTHSASTAIAKTTRIYASTDRGATWVLRSSSDIDLGTRQADEPQLCHLSGGRLGLIMRSDGTQIPASTPAKYYYSYLYSATSTDAGATWTEPVQAVWHGSGGPCPTLLPDDRVAIVHRGQSAPTNIVSGSDMYYPTRLSVVDEDMEPLRGAASELLLQQLDVVEGERRRHLYGGLLLGVDDEPDRIIYSSESGDGTGDYQTATLYERELVWL